MGRKCWENMKSNEQSFFMLFCRKRKGFNNLRNYVKLTSPRKSVSLSFLDGFVSFIIFFHQVNNLILYLTFSTFGKKGHL